MDDKLLEILNLAITGDQLAFDTLVEHFSPKLRSVARAYLGDTAEVEDVLQEVWIKVFDKLDTLLEPDKLPSWLMVIMRHHCLKRRSGEKKRQSRLVPLTFDERWELLEAIADNSASVEQLLEQSELAKVVAATLARMPEAYSLVLHLYYLEELPVKEIAELLGESVTTVKWRLHQGRLLFRKSASARLLEGYVN